MGPMPGSWLLELVRMGVPLVEACVAFRKHPYDPRGKRIFRGGDECPGFHKSLGGYLSGPLVATVLFSQVSPMWNLCGPYRASLSHVVT